MVQCGCCIVWVKLMTWQKWKANFKLFNKTLTNCLLCIDNIFDHWKHELFVFIHVTCAVLCCHFLKFHRLNAQWQNKALKFCWIFYLNFARFQCIPRLMYLPVSFEASAKWFKSFRGYIKRAHIMHLILLTIKIGHWWEKGALEAEEKVQMAGHCFL